MNYCRCAASVRVGILGCATLFALACDRTLAPRRNRLAELRQEATGGFGAFYGRVRAFDPTQSCWKARRHLAAFW